MNRTINGYKYDLPHIRDLREADPGTWEGHTADGRPFFIVGGRRAGVGLRDWIVLASRVFGELTPQPVKSLVEGLRRLNEKAAPPRGRGRHRAAA